MYNPWVSVLQDIKNYQEVDTTPEILQNMNENACIHVKLVFDPLFKFISELKLDITLKCNCNCYVWRLNMAASYHAAMGKKIIFNQNFFMHFHLQKQPVDN